jgi:hypothetical protein
MPLAGASVTLAGQPSKVGGTITRVVGWLVLAGGWALALVVVGVLAVLDAPLGGMLAVGGPIALIASLSAYALLRGGRELKKAGDDAEQSTKDQAIFALAKTRNGVLTAPMVAPALHISLVEADNILTRLAKGQPEQVTVDLDDEGNVLYRFPAIAWGTPGLAPNAPAVPSRPPPRPRIADERAVRVDAREPLEEAAFEHADSAGLRSRT